MEGMCPEADRFSREFLMQTSLQLLMAALDRQFPEAGDSLVEFFEVAVVGAKEGGEGGDKVVIG
jgi:hypothetical protein